MNNVHARTAYMLQVHTNPEQVNKLIKQLIIQDLADVYVHIDQKNYDSMKGKIVEGPNVKVLQQSVNCEWGDISQVDATLLLLKEVIESRKQYDFVCLRSGQDLLIREGFKDFLLDNKEKIFMSYRKLPITDLGLMLINWPKAARRRYTTAHPMRIYRRLLMSIYGRGINLAPNKKYWPFNYEIYKGSQWFTIPFEVAEYVLKFLDENEWYYRFFENTLVPDESFFHTLIMNSHYKKHVVNDNLMFLKWGETLSERNSPQYLISKDIKLIEESKKFFARKFDMNNDSQIVDYFADNVVFEKSRKLSLQQV